MAPEREVEESCRHREAKAREMEVEVEICRHREEKAQEREAVESCRHKED
jgi:hypothetical protein